MCSSLINIRQWLQNWYQHPKIALKKPVTITILVTNNLTTVKLGFGLLLVSVFLVVQWLWMVYCEDGAQDQIFISVYFRLFFLLKTGFFILLLILRVLGLGNRVDLIDNPSRVGLGSKASPSSLVHSLAQHTSYLKHQDPIPAF